MQGGGGAQALAHDAPLYGCGHDDAALTRPTTSKHGTRHSHDNSVASMRACTEPQRRPAVTEFTAGGRKAVSTDVFFFPPRPDGPDWTRPNDESQAAARPARTYARTRPRSGRVDGTRQYAVLLRRRSIFAGARLTPSPLPAPPALVAELMHDESVERGGQLAN